MADEVAELVLSFVEKSGGILKIEEAVRVFKSIAKDGRPDLFVKKIGDSSGACTQMFAAALLGFSLAAIIHNERQQSNGR
jgi:hypothetical protein